MYDNLDRGRRIEVLCHQAFRSTLRTIARKGRKVRECACIFFKVDATQEGCVHAYQNQACAHPFCFKDHSQYFQDFSLLFLASSNRTCSRSLTRYFLNFSIFYHIKENLQIGSSIKPNFASGQQKRAREVGRRSERSEDGRRIRSHRACHFVSKTKIQDKRGNKLWELCISFIIV